MKRRARPIIVLALLAVSPALSLPDAHANPPGRGRVNNRQCRQQARIGQGVASGSLTGKEAIKLRMGQRKIAARESALRASGNGLTRQERVRLEQAQDNMSKKIYSEKHDDQSR